MDHDRPRKQLFSEPRMVQDLLEGFVAEEWVGRIDFETLERVPSSFVSEDFKEREDDVIWRMRLKDETWLYLYLLLEFQSTVERFMALRFQVYIGLLYQDLLKQHREGPVSLLLPDGTLPPVFPLVLYNGRPEWNAPRDVADLIHPVSGLDGYRPHCRYLLLDESRCPTEEQLREHRPVAFAFELERADTTAALLQAFDRALSWPADPELVRLMRLISRWVTDVLIPGRFQEQPVPELPALGEVRSMLEQRVEEWTQQWKEQGLQQGLQQGRAEGRAEGRVEVLVGLVARRFGPLDPEQEGRLRAADPALLQERLFSAQTFEELLAP